MDSINNNFRFHLICKGSEKNIEFQVEYKNEEDHFITTLPDKDMFKELPKPRGNNMSRIFMTPDMFISLLKISFSDQWESAVVQLNHQRCFKKEDQFYKYLESLLYEIRESRH